MASKLTAEQSSYFDDVLNRRPGLGLDEIASRHAEFEQLVMEGMIDEDDPIYIKMRSVGAYLLSAKGDYKSALVKLNEIVELSRRLGNLIWEIRTLNNIAYVKNLMGDVFEAIEIWEKLLLEDLTLADRALYATNLGAAYSKAMRPKDAMRVYHEALELVQDNDDPILKADLYNNLANLYRKSSSYEKAIDLYLLALDLYKERGSNERLALVYNNFCATYLDMREPDKADEYGVLALEYYDKYMPERTRSIVLNNIAAIADIRRDYQKAEDYYLLSLAQAEKSEDKEMMTNVLSNLSLISWENGRFDQAKDYALRAQTIAHEINDLYAEKTSYTRLKDAWQSMGDFAQAFLAQSVEMELEEQIYKSNTPLDIAQAEAGFLQKRLKAQIDKYREQNHALEESNSIITKKTMEMETQNNLLMATNSLLNRIISIIAHDVRGPVATIAKISEYLLDGTLRSDNPELMHSLYDSAQNTSHLIDELLELARKYKAGVDEDSEVFDLMESMYKGKRLADVSAKNKDIHIEIKSNRESIPIRIARNRLNLIIRNLMSNAIKYSPRGATINLDIEVNDDLLWLHVRDQGTGMDAAQIERIRTGRSFSKLGTQSEKGFGMGLVFVLEALIHTGGVLEIESEPGKGSCFSVCYHLSDLKP